MPVFDDIAYTGGRPRIVLENEERAVLVPHDIGAADIDVCLVRQIDVAHRRAIVAVAEDQLRRDDAVAQDMLLMVDIVEQQVDRGDPLRDAALEMLPFVARQDSRDHIERQDPVDRFGFRINRKGDSEIVELRIGIARALL